MKTIFTFLLLVLLTPTVSHLTAQTTLPNGDFEQWTGNKPDGWDASNFNFGIANVVTVFRDTVLPMSGSSNVLLETKTVNLGLGQPTVPGLITVGTLIIDFASGTGEVIGGIPFTGRPLALKGYINAEPAVGDSAMIAIGFSVWDGTKRDTIGAALAWFGTPHQEWVALEVPIDFYDTRTPDSMNIIISSSAVANLIVVDGSKLRVDDISFDYGGISVEQHFSGEPFSLWADGGKNLFYRLTSKDKPLVIEAYSVQGALVKRVVHIGTTGEGSISLSGVDTGIYIIRLTTDSGRHYSRKVFVGDVHF